MYMGLPATTTQVPRLALPPQRAPMKVGKYVFQNIDNPSPKKIYTIEIIIIFSKLKFDYYRSICIFSPAY